MTAHNPFHRSGRAAVLLARLPIDTSGHISGFMITRLTTTPAHSFYNASRLNLRTAVHAQVRCGWLTLHRAELSSANNTPGYPGAQGV
jgi:hypothetical protein